MADPRFFANRGPFPIAALAKLAGAVLAPDVPPDKSIADVAALDRATAADLSFFDNARYLDAFRTSAAGACVVAPTRARQAPPGMMLLLADEPYKAYARIAQAFYPPAAAVAGVHPRAVIDPTARLGAGCAIAANVVIEAGAELGAGTVVGANTTIGSNVVIGRDCRIGANVSLSHCLIGAGVTLHPGVRIGQDGFGFAPDPQGHVKVPQLGRVLIGDRCEIGANSTIDRGAGPDTVIGAGTWIDNLVQIGHNVEMGTGCIVVAQAGISGSTKLGDFVALGGQAGLTGHLHVGTGAQIAAQAGVMTDVPAGETWGGAPAMPIREFFRQTAMVKRLAGKKGDR